MSLRLMEITVPAEEERLVSELLKTADIFNLRKEKYNDWLVIRILVHKDKTEIISDHFRDHFSSTDGFSIILFPVEATLPEILLKESSEKEQKDQQKSKNVYERISREELYADISEGATLSKTYMIMVVLSSVVAAIGLMRGDMAVIIGAMVIAPLLTPNVALALAAILGDWHLGLHASKAIGVGILISIIFSQVIGFFFEINPDVPEILSRTKVGISDIILALASGSAGALAFTTGLSSSLTGVMVAVALLPPLVASGILSGAGHTQMALGAFLLFMTNVTCINFAVIVTFMINGIRPRTWLENEKAKKTTWIALGIWLSMLLIFLGMIILSLK